MASPAASRGSTPPERVGTPFLRRHACSCAPLRIHALGGTFAHTRLLGCGHLARALNVERPLAAAAAVAAAAAERRRRRGVDLAAAPPGPSCSVDPGGVSATVGSAPPRRPRDAFGDGTAALRRSRDALATVPPRFATVARRFGDGVRRFWRRLARLTADRRGTWHPTLGDKIHRIWSYRTVPSGRDARASPSVAKYREHLRHCSACRCPRVELSWHRLHITRSRRKRSASGSGTSARREQRRSFPPTAAHNDERR